MNKPKVVVIGAGFGGLSASAYLAKAGYDVTVIEKNSLPGGRAQVFESDGFKFDAGPSWYMMPDVFEEFFNHFDKKTSDFFSLKKLDPAYRVVVENDYHDISPYPEILKLIQKLDPKALPKFKKFYNQTKRDYATVRKGILDNPMQSLSVALRPDILKYLLSKEMYRSYASRIESITDNKDLQHILQFMSVFMGGSPADIPAIYALLSYVDMGLGVYYPEGGFGAVARGFESLCKDLGVNFKYDEEAKEIISSDNKAKLIKTSKGEYSADVVVANADYQHVEATLLNSRDSSYDNKYWEKSDVSPSGLIMLVGVDKKLKNLLHHTLFFDVDWDEHFKLLRQGVWSSEPLFYVSTPSLSDKSVAPNGKENLFVLAPQSAGVHPSKSELAETEKNILNRISKQVGIDISNHVKTRKTLTADYFEKTFNSYKGNAFGLSHTLKQSAVFRPKIQSQKLKNLYYVGQYTNPGTGVPMVVLSGKVTANLIQSNR